MPYSPDSPSAESFKAGYSDPFLAQYTAQQPVLVQEPLLSAQTRALSSTHGPNGHYPMTRLWREQLLAILAGGITLIMGALVLAAQFERGPLSLVFIPSPHFNGKLINASSVGTLVAAFATLMGTVGRQVASGVARAWLRRRALGGKGARINEWRTVSAGISIRDVHRTPFLARGLVLIFTLAMAINGSALAGIAIPGSASNVTYSPSPQEGNLTIVPYLGNGNVGGLVSCVDRNIAAPCAAGFAFPDMAKAFFDRLVAPDDYYYNVGSMMVVSAVPEVYLAGLVPNFVTHHGNYTEAEVSTPLTAFSTTCVQLDTAQIVNSQYSIYSTCELQTEYYGNASSLGHNVDLWGAICPLNDEVHWRIEMAVGEPSGTFGVQCDVNATEGRGIALSSGGGLVTAFGFSEYETFDILSVDDLQSSVTAFLAVLGAEIGAGGKVGYVGGGLRTAYDATHQILDIELVSSAISNSLAAASSYGYAELSETASKYNFTGGYPTHVRYTEQGYGWARSPKTIAWSVLCVFIGLVWLACAAYMIPGGTRYDPTDWFQTINTSAGSTLSQIPGTCTGGSLSSKVVDRNMLWYGEIAPGLIGFSQKELVAPVDARQKYGVINHGV